MHFFRNALGKITEIDTFWSIYLTLEPVAFSEPRPVQVAWVIDMTVVWAPMTAVGQSWVSADQS